MIWWLGATASVAFPRTDAALANPGRWSVRAKEWLDAGDLTRAIDTVTAELRDHPGDAHRRSFLFELLCFAGEWDRAGRQLDVIGHQDETPAGVAGVTTYRRMLES